MQWYQFLMFGKANRKVNQNTIIMLLLCSMCGFGQSAQAASIGLSKTQYGLYPVLSQLDMPWAVKSDQQSRLWITLMSGQLVVTSPLNLYQKPQPLTTQTVDLDLPELYVAGQGGLMDLLLLSDSTATQKHLLVSYAKGTESHNRLAIQRLTLDWMHTQDRWQLASSQLIFSVSPNKSTPVHYGARLAQLADKSVLVTVGDGFDWREQAQNKASGLGKILRMSATGEPLEDNPFYQSAIPVVTSNSTPTSDLSMTNWVYSLGHRNPQGLLVDQQGLIWAHEHGPAGGDEINLLLPGLNYGWPVVTQGIDYSGAQITPFTQYQGMTPPVVNWTPSIAPSGFIRYEGKLFPELDKAFIVTSLKLKGIVAVNIKDGVYESQVTLDAQRMTVTKGQISTTPLPRLRDITTLPSGEILILSDGNDAQLLHLKIHKQYE